MLRRCDASSSTLRGAVTSFRGELYGGFMSAPRRGQVVKSFLDAEDEEGSVSTKRKLERRHEKARDDVKLRRGRMKRASISLKTGKEADKLKKRSES